MRRSPLVALALVATTIGGLAPAAAVPAAAPDHRTRALDGAPASRTEVLSRVAAGPEGTAGLPTSPDFYDRVAGAGRYETAVEVSRRLVCDTGDPGCTDFNSPDLPLQAVFVASAQTFPDALGAGPVAAGLGPLLLVPASGTVPAVVRAELARIDPPVIHVVGGTGAVSDGVAAQLAPYAGAGGVQRIAGSSRYDTAARLARVNDELWRAEDADGDGVADGVGLDTVVLASGETFADALAGGGAAANSRGSLMLVTKAALPATTKAALQAIAPRRVVILGGTGVVSAGVESAVRAALPGRKVVRAAGAGRYDTAIALSKQVFPAGSQEAFVVNALNFPDALASAPLAGYWNASTLLTAGPCVTAATRAEASRLDPVYVDALGGTAVVSDAALHLVTC